MFRLFAAVTLLATVASAQVRTPFDAFVVQADHEARFVKTLDLDNDGWMDVVSGWQNTIDNAPYLVAGYYNDHTGQLIRRWVISTPSLSPGTYNGTYAVGFDAHDAWDVGDVNQDGKQDFAFATRTTCKVFISNGTLAPTAVVTQSLGVNPIGTSLTLADFDLDGDLELALNSGNTIGIYDIDLQNGVLVSRSTVTCPTWKPGRLVAAELTGDATPDLFAFGNYIVPVQNGVLGTPIAYSDATPPALNYEQRNDVGDIDGDGDLDAITFFKRDVAGSPHGYRVLRRISRTQLVEEPAVNSGGPARLLVDVDADGDLDAVCCGGSGIPPPGITGNVTISTLRIALNDGLGNFAESIDVPNLGSTAIAGVVDMDHDGRVDFVAGRGIYFQRRPLVGQLVPVIATGMQSDRTCADIDGDGDMDFDVLPWSMNRNRGDGVTTLEPINLPAPPAGLAYIGQGHHADWDRDGDQDILMLTTVGPVRAGLDLLRNRGDGVFVSEGLVCGPDGLSEYSYYVNDGLAADVDQDGDKDLILRKFSDSGGLANSTWWRNDGATVFVKQQTLLDFIAIEVFDFDGDGISDWIGSWAGSAVADVKLSWARGLGNGVMAAGVPLTGGEHWVGFDVGDFDSDGDIDFVSIPSQTYSSATARKARLLWNQGNGSFGVEDFPLELNVESTLECVSTIDVDNDGRLDFIVGPVRNTINAAAIYLRKADNSGFEEPIIQVLLGAPIAGAFTRGVASDVDGDGDADYVSHNRCFENMLFDGASAGSRLQHDTGVAGSGGIRPVLGAKGPFRVGQVARLILRGARPSARVFLVTETSSSVPTTVLPNSIITRPPYDPRIFMLNTSGVFGGEAGSGWCEVPFMVPPSLAGVTRHYTMLVADPASHGGRSISNMLTIAYAP